MIGLWVPFFFPASLHSSELSKYSAGCRYPCDNLEMGPKNREFLTHSNTKTVLSSNDCIMWGLLLCGLENDLVASQLTSPLVLVMTQKFQYSVPALQSQAGRSSGGLPHKKGTEGVRMRGAARWRLTSSLGKEMSQPVSQPRSSAFILGIVPPHCSCLSVTLSP